MTEQNANVVIAIPARGGSKRLLRKNLLDIEGESMIVHTIKAALDSKLASVVYVCTEDDEIAEVSEKAGASVFRIPETITKDDDSSTIPVLRLLAWLEENGEIEGDEFVFNLQPTSPLRNSEDIRASLKKLQSSNSSFLVSVTSIDPHYFHWAVTEDGPTWRMYFREEFLKERIYLPEVMRPNGAIKLSTLSALRETGHYFGDPLTVYEMPEERSIHVATEFDLICARALASRFDG